jgi:ATP synthase protein I
MSADRRSASWIRYSGIGLELAGVIAGLALLGYWIDRRYGTSPWGILGGVCVGLVGGLYNLVRESLEAIREARREDADAEDKG